MAKQIDRDLFQKAYDAPYESDLDSDEQAKLEALAGPIFVELISPNDSPEEKARKIAKNAAIHAMAELDHG